MTVVVADSPHGLPAQPVPDHAGGLVLVGVAGEFGVPDARKLFGHRDDDASAVLYVFREVHAGQISDGVSAMSKLNRAAASSSTRKTATFFLTRPMSSGSGSSRGLPTGRFVLFGSFPFGSISVRSELRESD